MTLLVSAFYLFYFAIVGVYVIFMPNALIEVGYSAVEVGAIFAAAPLVRFAVPFIFVKKLSLNHTSFNIALIMICLAASVFWMALDSFWMLFLTNIMLGIGMALMLPYVEVIVLESIGKERYGRVRLWGSVGFIAIALLLGELPHTIAFTVGSFVVMIFATAFCGYVVALHERGRAGSSLQMSDGLLPILTNRWLWIGFFLMQVSFGAFYNFFTIYELDNNIAISTTVYLWSVAIVAEIVLFYFQAPLLRRKLILLLQFAALVTVLRWLIVWFFPQSVAMLFVSQMMHAVSFALFHTASIAYLFTIYRDRKLAQQFFVGVSYGLGAFIGAFGSGYVYEYYPQQLFLVAAFVALLAFVALVVYDKGDKKSLVS